MLKRFFISMLGTIAGLWVSMILFFICSIFGLTILIGKAIGETAESPKEGVLCIDLSGVIDEYPAEISFESLLSNQGKAQNLADITNAIRLSAKDKKIKGIYLNCKMGSLGFASREEIVDALKEFSTNGKWIIAYADSYEQGDYYVASCADKIYLNPVGTVSITGLSATTLFFKNLLEKAGVEMQVVKVGQFKSAVEPFIRTDMSEPSEFQTRIFLTQIWNNISATIARNRNISVDEINQLADSLCFTWPAENFKAKKIVTALKYQSEVEAELRDKLGIKKNKDIPYIYPSDYMASNLSKLGKSNKKHIAVLYAAGDIVDEGTTGISAEQIVPQIYELINDDNVCALVLRVNSGGGSAFASEQIWHALEDFKATDRPFYVSMGDYAASGGYYISSGADKIYADPNTLTGSIGIFGLIPNAEKLLTDKLGINFQTVETNPGATVPAIYKGMSEKQYDAMQQYVSHGYDVFVDRVNQGRHLGVDSIKAIGGGRVWDGTSALNIGLVDELGNLYDAIRDIANEVDIDANNFVNYPSIEDNFLATFLNSANTDINVKINDVTIDEFMHYIEVAKNAAELNPLQTRMEPVIIK